MLRLTWQSESAQKYPDSSIKLLISEIKQFAIAVQHFQYFFIILPKILSQHNFIQSLNLNDVGRYGIRGILVDESFKYVIVDCVFWFLIKHEYELLYFLMEFLNVVYAIQLIDELSINIGIIPAL